MFDFERLESRMKEKGLSGTYIAQSLGKGRTWFGDLKRGRAKISSDTLHGMADLLDTTPAYLLGETDQKEKPVSENRNELENELLKRFRELPPDKQADFLLQVKALAKAHGAPDYQDTSDNS